MLDNVHSNVTSHSYFDEMLTWRTCQEREVFFLLFKSLVTLVSSRDSLGGFNEAFRSTNYTTNTLFYSKYSAKEQRRDNSDEITLNSSEEIARQEKSFARLHAHTRVARVAADESR